MFKTVGEKSRRVMLIELVQRTDPGAVLTYEELGALFGLDSRTDIQGAVNGAKRSVEANTKKSLVAVTNKGYRVAHPRSEEHTSELQSRFDLVCRLLLEKQKVKA